jgi:hypothetical protein
MDINNAPFNLRVRHSGFKAGAANFRLALDVGNSQGIIQTNWGYP